MKHKRFKFIDLFAGLGGFHVALSRLGGDCVFAAEWQEHLRHLYERNHGILPHGDVTKLDLDSIPEHDVLTAGFPCQPFSKAGEQLGFECTKQGGLFFDVVEILKFRSPSFFILENVPNSGMALMDLVTMWRPSGSRLTISEYHKFGSEFISLDRGSRL